MRDSNIGMLYFVRLLIQAVLKVFKINKKTSSKPDKIRIVQRHQNTEGLTKKREAELCSKANSEAAITNIFNCKVM